MQASTRLLSAIILLLTITLFTIPACKSEKLDESTPTPTTSNLQSTHPLAVRVTKPLTKNLQTQLRYTATIHPRHQIQVTARVPGTLTSFPAAEGQYVTKNQRIAHLTAPEFSLRQQRADAEMQRLETDTQLACQLAETNRKLAETNALPTTTADTSDARCQAAQHALKAAAASHAETSIMNRRSSETAPFDAIILKHIAEPGENIQPGRPLLLLGTRQLEARLQLSEYDLKTHNITPKTPVFVQFNPNSPSDPIPATIRQFSPTATGPARTVELFIVLPDELPDYLRPGISIEVTLVTAQSTTDQAVPLNAIAQSNTDNDQSHLFILRDKTLEKITIATGIQQDDWIETHTQLDPETRIVVGNLSALTDGMTVYPVEVSGDQP